MRECLVVFCDLFRLLFLWAVQITEGRAGNKEPPPAQASSSNQALVYRRTRLLHRLKQKALIKKPGSHSLQSQVTSFQTDSSASFGPLGPWERPLYGFPAWKGFLEGPSCQPCPRLAPSIYFLRTLTALRRTVYSDYNGDMERADPRGSSQPASVWDHTIRHRMMPNFDL